MQQSSEAPLHSPQVVDHIEQRLENLPVHVVAHVGETALRLTHIDMHPTMERDYMGQKIIERDFANTISTHPVEAYKYEAEALEAAQRGEEKIAGVLHESSSLLSSAHEILLAEGVQFEVPAQETEQEKILREAQERTAIVDRAIDVATRLSIEAHHNGDSTRAIEIIESIQFLQTLRSRERTTDAKQRNTMRDLVHAGAAAEVIEALKESRKIHIDGSYMKRLSDSAPKTQILSIATGQKLNYDFEATGVQTPENGERFLNIEDARDVLAVITSSADMPETTKRAYLDKLKNFDVYENLAFHLAQFPKLQDAAPLYETLEQAVRSSSESRFSELLKYDVAPHDVLSYARALDIEPSKLGELFATRDPEHNERKKLDLPKLHTYAELIGQYPDHKSIIFKLIRDGMGVEHAEMMRNSIIQIQETGLRDPTITNLLVLKKDKESIIRASREVVAYLDAHGMSERELQESISLQDSDFRSLSNIVRDIANNGNAEKVIEHTQIKVQLQKAYKAMYDAARYPLSSTEMLQLHPEMSTFPLMADRLHAIGIPTEVAQNIFDSWATYSAISEFAYEGNEMKGLQKPDESSLDKIASKQTTAFMTQLESIEAIHELYGAEALADLITTFGIHNFSRYSPERLKNQLDRWRQGALIKNVVVNAHADWNNFTKDGIAFEEPEELSQTMVFEASSALETSKIAIQVGTYERAHQREPQIDRFIVHGHGNPNVILMGARNELIDTSLYRRAAQDRSRLPQAESNDYKRHLGDKYTIILQSCSTGGKNGMGKNIAETMHDAHNANVISSPVSVTSAIIKADGTVEFTGDKGQATHAVIYGSNDQK